MIDPDDPSASPAEIDTKASRSIFLGMLGLVIAGAVSYQVLKRKAVPPPAAIASDPVLVEGRQVYLDRCVSCHGESGRGDGPIAKSLAGPPPGNLTDQEWKHGGRPDQVESVVATGVRDTAMPGWKGTLGAEQVRAVTAYTLYLAGQYDKEQFPPAAK